MIRAVLLLSALLLSSYSAFALTGADDHVVNEKNAVVFFYGFEVERITGIHEDEIEHYGCRYTIDRQSFMNVLQPNSSTNKYQRLDVRGEVVFSKDTIYFIDRDGIVRLGNKEYLLDKKLFISEIKPTGTC